MTRSAWRAWLCGIRGVLVGLSVSSIAAAGGWQALLDEHAAPAWRGWQTPGLPAGWRLDQGVLSKHGVVEDLKSTHHVEHGLNGHRLLCYALRGADWRRRVAASKFAPYAGYGRAEQGLLGIQGDHEGELAIRALRIRELP